MKRWLVLHCMELIRMNYCSYGLMIDHCVQGQGLGYQAILAIIADLKSKKQSQITCIMIGYQPDNDGARFT